MDELHKQKIIRGQKIRKRKRIEKDLSDVNSEIEKLNEKIVKLESTKE